jgi:hypothetical protein
MKSRITSKENKNSETLKDTSEKSINGHFCVTKKQTNV